MHDKNQNMIRIIEPQQSQAKQRAARQVEWLLDQCQREPARSLPALGFRLETDGVVFAYTGDTGPTHDVEKLARGADLLLSEATWQDREDLLPFHLSARQAAIHAREAGVGGLVLTHIWPTLDTDVSRAQAAEEYHGPLDVAVEGASFEVDR